MAELSTLGSVIKTAYEGQSNTNAYTDAEKQKLAGVAAGATALKIGTAATDAKAGNYVPAWGDVTGKPTLFSGAYADLSGKPTLGTAASMASTAFATAAQGEKADSAVQPAALAPYAKTADLPKGAAVADVEAAPTMEEFNGLLASLRTAGLIAT